MCVCQLRVVLHLLYARTFYFVISFVLFLSFFSPTGSNRLRPCCLRVCVCVRVFFRLADSFVSCQLFNVVYLSYFLLMTTLMRFFVPFIFIFLWFGIYKHRTHQKKLEFYCSEDSFLDIQPDRMLLFRIIFRIFIQWRAFSHFIFSFFFEFFEIVRIFQAENPDFDWNCSILFRNDKFLS